MRLGAQRSFFRRWPLACPIACIVSLSLLAIAASVASAAHSKARSIEPIDASFQVGDSGAIEASLDPPIEGVLRIIVQATESADLHQQRGSAGAGSSQAGSSQSGRNSLTLEVMQWDRPIPFRLVSQSGRHNPFAARPALLVADIDVNDLTPGVPVRVRVSSNLPASSNSAPPDLEGHAYAIVY